MGHTTQKLFLFLLIGLVACQQQPLHDHDSAHHEESTASHPARGPHGGKLFEQDGFALEVTIYEPDIPPQSRVYAYQDGNPLDPALVTLVTELHRIDRVDTIHYQKQEDYLQGDKIVEEPHSFDVKLDATYHGKRYQWSYSSYEGRTTISDAAMRSIGVKVERTAGATMSSRLLVQGQVLPDRTKVVHLTPRFPGLLKEIHKAAGSSVVKGETVATVEANESLRSYNIVASRSGHVISTHAAVGEIVGDSQPIMTIGDFSTLWIELIIPKEEFPLLKMGQPVVVKRDSVDDSLKPHVTGRITYLAPYADGDTQTRLARAEVENLENALVPELFVEAEVITRSRDVPVAIKAEALQTFRDWNVVFKKVGEVYEIAIVELGERDGDWIEVLSGISAGTEYVTENSFVVKADVMKAGATHDH